MQLHKDEETKKIPHFFYLWAKADRDNTKQIHRLIYQDQPACFLYYPFVFYAVSSEYENTDNLFTLSMPIYTMKDWYFRKVESSSKERR